MKNNNISYCYISGMHGDVTVPFMDKFFKEKNTNFYVITENYSDFLIWKKDDIDVIYLYDQRFIFNQKIYDKISREIYDNISLENLILTEYSYYKIPKFILKSKVEKILKKLSGVFDQYEFNYVIQKPGGEILRRIIYNLENSEYVKENYTIGESYLYNLSVLYEGEFKQFKKMKFKKSSTEEVEKLLDESFSNKEFTYNSSLPKPKKSKAEVLKDLFFAKNYNIIFSYFSIRLNNEIVGKLRRTFTNFIYKNIDEIDSKSFYFFPLNVQAESELYVRNYVFSEQSRTLNDLITLIPKNKKLVVKEHPGFSKSLSLYQIYRLYCKGVVFADPYIKSKELILKSDGVMAVSSTVLIESIVYEKPILILGNWSYGKYILNRSMEFDIETIQCFLKYTNNFKVDKIEFFKKLYETYLINGIGYKDHEMLKKYLDEIYNLEDKK